MTIFFTADTHFGHGGAKGLYRRPFGTIADMNTTMIDGWRERVEAEDEIWHLGDFALGPSGQAMAELLARLPGRKHLITGNNDGPATTSLAGWSSVQAYAELVVEGVELVLCHYAFRTWRNMGRGSMNLHGHSHGRLRPLPRQVDVGVDVWDFRPVTLGEILAARRSSKAAAP
jgi:calcineurin-like phosphoesterase family protein